MLVSIHNVYATSKLSVEIRCGDLTATAWFVGSSISSRVAGAEFISEMGDAELTGSECSVFNKAVTSRQRWDLSGPPHIIRTPPPARNHHSNHSSSAIYVVESKLSALNTKYSILTPIYSPQNHTSSNCLSSKCGFKAEICSFYVSRAAESQILDRNIDYVISHVLGAWMTTGFI